MHFNESERKAMWCLVFPDISWEDIQKIINTPLTLSCFEYDYRYGNNRLPIYHYLDELNRPRLWSGTDNQVPEEDRIGYFKQLLNLLPRSYKIVNLNS